MEDPLKDIIEKKRAEVAALKAKTSFAELEGMVAQQEPPRNFFAAVTNHPDAFHFSVIAEVTRRTLTPDGWAWIRSGLETAYDPGAIARRYAANGAAAIGCTTDETFYAGSVSHIEQIRQAVPLPVLRTDFIIDPWQLWESRAHGADAVLLMGDLLTISEMVDMLILAQRLGLTVLLQVHSVETLLRVRPHVGFPHPSYFLLGIDNRDPQTRTVNLNHTLRLLDMVEDKSILVSASGVRTNKDATWLRHHGVRIVLAGEELMAHEDPGAALAGLRGQPVR